MEAGDSFYMQGSRQVVSSILSKVLWISTTYALWRDKKKLEMWPKDMDTPAWKTSMQIANTWKT